MRRVEEPAPKTPLRTTLSIAMFSTAAALMFGPANAQSAPTLGAVSLCADGGTCCDAGGTCYPNSCSDSSCAVPNKYWYTKGDQCPPV